MDERGKAVKEAGPAIPIQVLGAEGVPMAGDQLLVVEEAAASREIAQRRRQYDNGHPLSDSDWIDRKQAQHCGNNHSC